MHQFEVLFFEFLESRLPDMLDGILSHVKGELNGDAVAVVHGLFGAGVGNFDGAENDPEPHEKEDGEESSEEMVEGHEDAVDGGSGSREVYDDVPDRPDKRWHR